MWNYWERGYRISPPNGYTKEDETLRAAMEYERCREYAPDFDNASPKNKLTQLESHIWPEFACLEVFSKILVK